MDSNSGNDGSVVNERRKVSLTDMGGGNAEAGSGDKSTIGQNFANAVNCESLTESLDNLRMRNDGEVTDNSDVVELARSRMETQKQKQMARKATWIAESRSEVLEREEFAQTNLLQHLDLDAWEEIIDKLGPEEKVMMSKMAWEWRTLLERQRVLFLFGKVFPILCQHSFTPNEWGGDRRETVSCVQNCRLVCKTWKDSIDELLSLHNVTATDTGTPDGIPECLVAILMFDDLVSFNHSSEHSYRGTNPFFSRFFSGGPIYLDWWDFGQYCRELDRVVSRWGGELWTLNFMYDKERLVGTYLFLRRCLSLTPNLKKLMLIDGDHNKMMDIDRHWRLLEGELGGDEEYGRLRSRMETDPLPELPHLRSLVFANFAAAPLVQAALNKYGDTLELLEFLGVGQDRISGGYMDPGEFVEATPLPALKKYSCWYGATTFKSFGLRPQTTRISHWNYQHLSSLNELDLTYIDILEGAEVGNIFKTVSSCAPTLCRLRLLFNFRTETPTARNWQDRLPDGISLELPHLEVLDLCIAQSKITSVDFLLPLVSLKELSFSYDAAKSDFVRNGKGIIQFVGYRNKRFYKSNIWNLLPELRLVKLKTVSVIKSWELHAKGQCGNQFPIYEDKEATVYSRDVLRKPLGTSGSD